MTHFRTDDTDPDMGYVQYVLKLQHIKPWQDMPTILVQRGEFIKYCNRIAEAIGITYGTPPSMVDMILSDKSERDPGDEPATIIQARLAKNKTV